MKLIKSDGKVCWAENNMKGLEMSRERDRPEIDRGQLRNILVDSVQADSIRWGMKLAHVEAKGLKYSLHFEHGVEEGFDLIVGADGAWSKVRPLVTDQVPEYSGISLVELKFEEVSTKKEWLSKFSGSGTVFMMDEGRFLVCSAQWK